MVFVVDWTGSTTSCDSSWHSFSEGTFYLGIDTTVDQAYLYTAGDWYYWMDGTTTGQRFQGESSWIAGTGVDTQELLDVQWE